MIAVRVMFADPTYNYVTRINATIEDARRYFIGSPINFGDTDSHPSDDVQVPVGVEQVADAVQP